MYASKDRNEYEAMVARVRKHYGNAVEIGGYNSHDMVKLRRLDAQREIDEAKARDQRPLTEAGQRLHQSRERAMKAWRKISEGTEALAKNRRLHLINGVSPEMLEPVDMPRWPEQGALTVAAYDELNAEAASLATELEARASKLISYIGEWERATPDQQNRMLILALADRLDRFGAPTK